MLRMLLTAGPSARKGQRFVRRWPGGEREFLALAVVTDGPEPGPPCGLCRQVLAEFAADLPIYLGNLAGKVVELNLATLFPAAFGSGFLEGKKNG